jgi:transposase
VTAPLPPNATLQAPLMAGATEERRLLAVDCKRLILIERFPRVQDFASYCRLVKWAKASAGKRSGASGTQIGNAHLKWAFSEAAVLFLRDNPAGQKFLTRLEKKHSKGQALTILAHKVARAVYDMVKRKTAFDRHRFLNA